MVTNVSYTITETIIVTLAQAKKQLRLETDFIEEDDLIQSYIDTAIANCENFTGSAIVAKDMIIEMDCFDNPLIFEAFPLQSVDSVSYFPEDGGEEITMPSTDYKLTQQSDKHFVLRFLKELPAIEKNFDAVTVTIKLGYVTTPKPVVQAILLQLADMYERREDRTETITTASAALLRPYKKY
jgi:uncharacterized phiE125 gp8 family phage protein